MQTVHEAEDQAKVEALAASMRADGWVGAPVVVWDDAYQITGVHRAAAADLAGIEMETIDLSAVFAEDGADWFAAVETYNAGDGSYWTTDVEPMIEMLSAEIKAKYGIDWQ